MSHVVTLEMENVKDLDALAAAAERIGMELVRNVSHYKWWGRSVGDYAIPEHFTAADLGKCDHILRLKGNSNAYEVGVVQARNGEPGYQLIYDFYGSLGRPVQECFGATGEHIKQAYAVEVAKKYWLGQGWQVTENRKEDGTVMLNAAQF